MFYFFKNTINVYNNSKCSNPVIYRTSGLLWSLLGALTQLLYSVNRNNQTWHPTRCARRTVWRCRHWS